MTAQPDPYQQPPRVISSLNPDEGQVVRELVFDRLKVAAHASVTRQVLVENARVTTAVDMLSDNLLVQLESFVIGDDRKTVRWRLVEYRPASWWEYLKRRHAPRWFLDRYPVKHQRHERTLSLPVRSLYPEVPVPPGLGPVVFHTMDPPAFSMEQL